jgi:RNA polymerase sigma factor (sigma-70 family)
LKENNNCNTIYKLADHLFRYESGKMVAVLTRIFGLHNLELAEDVMQEAFAKALKDWTYKVPENPSAWLMRTAKNKAIDLIRRERYHKEFSEETAALLKSEYTTVPVIEKLFMENEIQDSQLRMIFACCHPALAEADQMALTLKNCSGFGIREIAGALLTNEETIKKRLQRAKAFIVEKNIRFDIPEGSDLKKRLDVVLHILYLIFNEGYNSGNKDTLIRKDLCEEAIRLSLLLTENKFTGSAKSYSLVALMALLSSRFDARLDESGEIILLEDQDRSKWSQELIAAGVEYMEKASEGNEINEYHLQAAIVATHSFAKTFDETDWQLILSLYDRLAEINPSPSVFLNRAIVLGKIAGPAKAIKEILSIEKIEKLIETHYLFPAVLGDLYKQTGDKKMAARYLREATALTTSVTERRLLEKKLNSLSC